MRVALAHDYVTQTGGAERVALAMADAFPGAPLHTIAYEPSCTFAQFAQVDVRTSPLNRVRVLREDPRRGLPALPWAVGRIAVDPGVDALVVSSSGWAHGIRSAAPKIVYCHNPPRWLYQSDDYLIDQPKAVRAALRALGPPLRRWDQRAAHSAARYLVNSTVVRERVERVYGISAHVLHPPVNIDVEAAREAPAGLAPGYLLTVSRQRGYKNVHVLCEVVADMPDQRLVVVGGLPQGRSWPSNIVGLKGVSDAELRWIYANCRGLVATSFEDFGLTPIEAYAFGRPTAALRAGGFLDTTMPGVTGVWIEDVSPAAVRQGVQDLLAFEPDEDAIRAHAETFSLQRFQVALRRHVEDVVARRSG